MPRTSVVEPVQTEQPWERVDWPPEHEQKMYRDWGVYYRFKGKLEKAVQYLDKALAINPEDTTALLRRSLCMRRLAQCGEAIQNSTEALNLAGTNSNIHKEFCLGLYEMNQFESCRVELLGGLTQYASEPNKVEEFKNYIGVINSNMIDSMGDPLLPFLLKHGKLYMRAWEEKKHEGLIDDRPLWKILHEQGKCDVQSVLEGEEIPQPPREKARQERGFKVLNQIYLNRTWTDVGFLRRLRKNPNLLPDHCKNGSAPELKDLVDKKYDVVIKLLKMLKARSPMYSETLRQFPHAKQREKRLQEQLFMIQNHVRRNMHTVLHNVHLLRSMGETAKLVEYIEGFMGDYVVLQTQRVMPWKFEFTNEIYNTVALAYSDAYKVPPTVSGLRSVAAVLGIGREVVDKPSVYVFGERNTYHVEGTVDSTIQAYRNHVHRLERRLLFAEYGIERSYLFYELALQHLRQSHYDECRQNARNAIQAAKECCSNLWQFLSTMLLVKTFSTLNKIEACKDAILEAAEIALQLQNPGLVEFMELLRKINTEALIRRKTSRHSLESIATSKKNQRGLSTVDSIPDDNVSEYTIKSPKGLLANASLSKVNAKMKKTSSVNLVIPQK